MKFKLLESVLTSFKQGLNTYFIYLNPTSGELHSKEDSKYNRGIIDAEGNLYMEAKWFEKTPSESHEYYSELIHNHLLDRLQKEGKLLNLRSDWWQAESSSYKYALFVQRAGNSFDFYLAESYESELLLDKEVVESFFKKAKIKNPYLNFYFESIK